MSAPDSAHLTEKDRAIGAHADIAASTLIARVIPNVTGLDKEFDYVVPDALAGDVESGLLAPGSIVRVELHGRRIGGWVRWIRPFGELAAGSGSDGRHWKPIAKVSGRGPAPELIELAEWAARRWASTRIRPFLVTASPVRAVRSLPTRAARRTASASDAGLGPASPATAALLAAGGGVLRLPPRDDVLPAVRAAVRLGPTLVVAPSVAAVETFAARLRQERLSVAVVPEQWALAAAGVDVVIGARTAAWAPCPDLAAAVLIDEHDEAHQEERAPTWHAREVLAERCRRAGAAFVAVSPVPTLTVLEMLTEPDGERAVAHPPPDRERRGWGQIEVVDRRGDRPWSRSLATSELIDVLRSDQRVVCVTNTTGRGRVLACRSCEELLRCERCDAAVALIDAATLVCSRCDLERPPVCQGCGGASFANLRPGVSRLREEFENAAARPVAAVTSTGFEGGDARDATARRGAAVDVFVGTEAALHRVHDVDVVVFVEFDSELLAPRLRTAEQALALLARAARLAPRVLVQTFQPDHEVIRAALAADPAIVAAAERERRAPLGFPPFGALATVRGGDRSVLAEGLVGSGVMAAVRDDTVLLRAGTWLELGDAVRAVPKPPGARWSVHVDPPRI